MHEFHHAILGLIFVRLPPQIWAMSLPGGTHQMEIRVDLAPSMTVQDLAEQARVAWGAHPFITLQATRHPCPYLTHCRMALMLLSANERLVLS